MRWAYQLPTRSAASTSRLDGTGRVQCPSSGHCTLWQDRPPRLLPSLCPDQPWRLNPSSRRSRCLPWPASTSHTLSPVEQPTPRVSRLWLLAFWVVLVAVDFLFDFVVRGHSLQRAM